MARIMHERVPLAVIEGGENMAEFQPDPFLTSLGMSVDQQRAYDAYCDAIVDASEAEMGLRTPSTRSSNMHTRKSSALSVNIPEKIGGGHVPSKNHRSLRCEHSADNAELVLFRDRRSRPRLENKSCRRARQCAHVPGSLSSHGQGKATLRLRIPFDSPRGIVRIRRRAGRAARYPLRPFGANGTLAERVIGRSVPSRLCSRRNTA